VDLELAPLDGRGKSGQEPDPVDVVEENRRLGVASRHDVIEPAGGPYAQWS
jgi:hypothetical protein